MKISYSSVLITLFLPKFFRNEKTRVIHTISYKMYSSPVEKFWESIDLFMIYIFTEVIYTLAV